MEETLRPFLRRYQRRAATKQITPTIPVGYPTYSSRTKHRRCWLRFLAHWRASPSTYLPGLISTVSKSEVVPNFAAFSLP